MIPDPPELVLHELYTRQCKGFKFFRRYVANLSHIISLLLQQFLKTWYSTCCTCKTLQIFCYNIQPSRYSIFECIVVVDLFIWACRHRRSQYPPSKSVITQILQENSHAVRTAKCVSFPFNLIAAPSLLQPEENLTLQNSTYNTDISEQLHRVFWLSFFLQSQAASSRKGEGSRNGGGNGGVHEWRVFWWRKS